MVASSSSTSMRRASTSMTMMSPSCTAQIGPPRTAAGAAALVAGQLDDGALGGEVAVEDREAAGRLQRLAERADDDLTLGLGRLGRVGADRPAVDRDGALVEQPGLLH